MLWHGGVEGRRSVARRGQHDLSHITTSSVVQLIKYTRRWNEDELRSSVWETGWRGDASVRV